MNLLVFGLGYSAQHFVHLNRRAYAQVTGTVRDLARARPLATDVELLAFSPERTDPLIEERIATADVMVVSIAPGTSNDPVLARFGRKLAATKRRQKILYLSTVGVYGDHGGEWVDETTYPTPQNERSKVRVDAEKAWLALGRDPSKSVHILRLSGIYGPGRNPLINLAAGRAHRIIKPGQVFNRIHVEDIARASSAILSEEGRGEIWNVTDDEPAPPQDVVTYAAEMMGIEPPPEQPFETAELSLMARSFYSENKRCANRKLKERLSFRLTFPTYREGIAALWAEGEGRKALPQPGVTA
jgi:nucleoside-diphosphate-sugar epimerase